MCGTKGDLWGFLREVDDTMKKFSHTIEESEQRLDSSTHSLSVSDSFSFSVLREHEMADTFVTKVLELRQTNFDTAWNDFATLQTNKQPTLGLGPKTSSSPSRSSPKKTKKEMISPLLTADDSMLSLLHPNLSPIAATQHELQQLSGNTKTMHLLPRSTLHVRNGIQTQVPPPGPVLRRAVANKMKQGAILSQSLTKEGKIGEMRSAYTTSTPPHSQSLKKKKQLPTLQSPGTTSQQKKPRQALTANKFVSLAAESATKTSSLSQAYLNPSWLSQQENFKTSTRPNSPNQSGGLDSLKSLHKKSSVLREIDAGQSLLIDIPNGLEDKIDRLIYAAAIRCYAPLDLFPPSSTSSSSPPLSPQDIYSQIYLTLPSTSLSKIRYEQKVMAWCQPTINRIKLKGIHFIKESLPASKLQMFLQNVNTPKELIQSCIHLIKELNRLVSLSQGFGSKEFQNDYSNILEEKGKVIVAMRAGISGTDNNSMSTTTEERNPPLSERQLSPRPLHSSQTESQGQLGTITESSRERKDMKVITQSAQQFLEKMITVGAWADIHAPVDLLLQHAAFLICPHDPTTTSTETETGASGVSLSSSRVPQPIHYRGDVNNPMTLYGLFGVSEDDKETNEELRCGQLAFQSFTTQLLQHISTETELRDLIRQRYRAAVIISTPFELQFKELGIVTTGDLIRFMSLGTAERMTTGGGSSANQKRRIFDIFSQMLKPYREQVEALLSMVISTSTHSKILPTTIQPRDTHTSGDTVISQHPQTQPSSWSQGDTGPLVDNPRLIQVPLAFDPKFQRGPLDPYGRPARLIGQLPALKPQSRQQNSSAGGGSHRRALSSHHGSVHHSLGDEEMNEIIGHFETNRRKETLEVEMRKGRVSQPSEEIRERYDSLPNNMWERSLEEHGDKYDEVRRVSENDLTNTMYSFDPQQLSAAQSFLEELPASADSHPPVSHHIHSKKSKVDKKSFPSTLSPSPTSSQFSIRYLHHHARAITPSNPFNTDTHFDRPYLCPYPSCGQSFSSTVTWNLHKKSHGMFPEYYAYKKKSVLGYDLDVEQMKRELMAELCHTESLPFQRQKEIHTLLK
jgi:hypothetical protein